MRNEPLLRVVSRPPALAHVFEQRRRMTAENDTNDANEPERTHNGTARATSTLSEPDSAAIDILIEHGFDLAAATNAHPALAARLAAAHQLFGRLDSYETEPVDESLVDLTLARIAREDENAASRMRLEPSALPKLGSGRWHDFIAIACAAILLVSIGAPIFAWMSGRNADLRCSENLRQLGAGIAAYHGDHRSMPMQASLLPDLTSLGGWQNYRNGKHLSSLVDGQYCSAGCTACGNDTTGEGYAYQVPNSTASFAWAGGFRAPAVADRNPVIDLMRRGRSVGTFSMNSPEHGGRGQNLLFTDGSVEFVATPVLVLPASAHLASHSENIWIPMDRSRLEDGVDAPAEWIGFDIFLMQ